MKWDSPFTLYSLLYVETADRPGLLVDLVKIITDINVAVGSGEFDTEVTIFSLKFAVLHGYYLTSMVIASLFVVSTGIVG